MPRILFFTALFALSNLAMVRGQEPDAEPPLEVVLEIDGQKFDAVVGEEAKVTIDGKVLSLKLMAKPTRLFLKEGVEFRYPSYFTYEFDDSTPGSRFYTVEGPSSMLMLQSIDRGLGDTDEFASSLRADLRNAYGESAVKEEPSQIRIPAGIVSGHQLTVKLVGETIVQEIYPVSDANAVLLFQTLTAEDGSIPAEAKEVKALLKATFQAAVPKDVQ